MVKSKFYQEAIYLSSWKISYPGGAKLAMVVSKVSIISSEETLQNGSNTARASPDKMFIPANV